MHLTTINNWRMAMHPITRDTKKKKEKEEKKKYLLVLRMLSTKAGSSDCRSTLLFSRLMIVFFEGLPVAILPFLVVAACVAIVLMGLLKNNMLVLLLLWCVSVSSVLLMLLAILTKQKLKTHLNFQGHLSGICLLGYWDQIPKDNENTIHIIFLHHATILPCSTTKLEIWFGLQVQQH